ncbi:MAG: class I SAM-dependent methyltransferase [Proteobacteria bacterium]|nr:class I SAM-dependent methyltransferase [Pseudomonadota bacterium]MBU1716918.1 class I SAM-dependent methyltransferase [Pseudomonadota bacterium]
MDRIPEPELMEGEEQALAYAQADFSDPNRLFVQIFSETFPDHLAGNVLDLGCGPADILLLFAQKWPTCTIHGVDGSASMLQHARHNITTHNMENRIQLIQGRLPDLDLPIPSFGAIISNSLLHHLPSPEIIWQTIKNYATLGTKIMIMDLMRPENTDAAQAIVEKYAASEPDILKKDFFNSLLAAYTVDEIKNQLTSHDLSELTVKTVSNRHLAVSGIIKLS